MNLFLGQAVTFKSTEKPNFMPQQSYSTSRPFNMNTGTNQTGSSQNWNQSNFKPFNSQGYESPITLGQSSDQTLNPTTRQNFGRQETTPSVSQHDMIQNLVKSVLSEMFLALRSQRNESRNEGKIYCQRSHELKILIPFIRGRVWKRNCFWMLLDVINRF